MFSNASNNGTASSNNTIFNLFEALFGGGNSSTVNNNINGVGNDTGLDFYNNGSFGNNSSSSFMAPDLQNNKTVDILKILELLQGGGGGS